MSDLRCVQRIIEKVDRERAYSWIHLIQSRGKVRGHMLSSRGGGGGMKDDMGGVGGWEIEKIFRSLPYTVKPVLFKWTNPRWRVLESTGLVSEEDREK